MSTFSCTTFRRAVMQWLLFSIVATDCVWASPHLHDAVNARMFMDSLGINTHVSNLAANPEPIIQELQYVGIKHVRDTLGSSPVQSLQQVSSSTGVRFDLGYGDYASNAGSAIITSDILNLQSASNLIEAIEGPNEPDWFGLYYNGTTGAVAVQQSQELLFTLAKQNLNGVTVYGPSFTYPAGGLASEVGDLAAYCNSAPLHAYPQSPTLGTYLPYEYIAEWKQFPPMITAIGRPVVITEGGWPTSQNADGVDEATQAKYLLDYLLDAFSQGISRTYLYELSDDNSDPAQTTGSVDYGIFHYDGTPKPAATMLANLHSLLPGGLASANSSSSLAYSVNNLPSNSHQLLLKTGHTFVLALWQEANLWDTTTHTEVPLASSQVGITLGSRASSVQVFDPLVGTTAQNTMRNVQEFTVSLPDHPIMVFIALH